MVQISQKLFADPDIFALDFDKSPLANSYEEYPFLLFEEAMPRELCQKIIQSLDAKESFKAALVGEGVDRSIRDTILHPPSSWLIKEYQKLFWRLQPKIEHFFGVNFLGATKPQVLEYRVGGHYRCHADNASELRQDGKIVGYKVVAPKRKVTTLLFLNDYGRDFEGGELKFCHLYDHRGNQACIYPQAGTFLVFPSNGLFAHEVGVVKKGKRFAVAQWHNVM